MINWLTHAPFSHHLSTPSHHTYTTFSPSLRREACWIFLLGFPRAWPPLGPKGGGVGLTPSSAKPPCLPACLLNTLLRVFFGLFSVTSRGTLFWGREVGQGRGTQKLLLARIFACLIYYISKIALPFPASSVCTWTEKSVNNNDIELSHRSQL